MRTFIINARNIKKADNLKLMAMILNVGAFVEFFILLILLIVVITAVALVHNGVLCLSCVVT